MQKLSKKKSTLGQIGSLGGSMIRILLLDIPLILAFGLYLTTDVLKVFHDEYLIPQLQLLNFNIPRDMTYYYRTCTEDDMSTNDTADLIVTEDMTPAEAVDNVMTHGGSVYPNLLSPETAHELREYIREANLVTQTFDHVISPGGRHTWGLRVDQHPSVPKALREIFSNPKFRESVFTITGEDPAVIEMNHITTLYGAKSQFVHEDITWGTPLRFARNYMPHYSLFIPLQNTTTQMGASAVCPGSHMCSAGNLFYCHETSFQVFENYDHWPVGWGFLYNQQLTHNGEAHTDPNAPDRVQLIMTFTPRPRYGEKELETRSVSEGGADFNWWGQWGHCWNDFASATERMLMPWELLRSFGIYKAPGTHWGWDYVTQSVGRIANSQNGWLRDDFDKFIDEGGLINVPQWLQGTVSDDTHTSMVWSEFALDTLRIWKYYLKRLHLGIVAVYLVGAFLVNAALFALRVRKGRELTINRTFFRLVVIHCILFLLANLTLRRIPKRSWGRHVKKGTLYQTPKRYGTLYIPATLPTTDDVLVPDDLQSDYLKAITRMFDVGHPGNKNFLDRIGDYSEGYDTLSPTLQQQLSADMRVWTRQEHGRILGKNIGNEWAELTKEMSERFCHKELMKASNPFIQHAVKWTDYLLSETKYGYWRDTIMHIENIPAMLRALQEKLLHLPLSSGTKATAITTASSSPHKNTRFVRSSLPSLPTIMKEDLFGDDSGMPPQPPEAEPFFGAWLNEGDQVEARYQQHSNDWFRGVVRRVHMDSATWSVVYDDGDSDVQLCRRCVRPFVPYAVGDSVRLFLEEGDEGYESVVTKVYPGEKYDIRIAALNKVEKEVPISKINRFDEDVIPLEVGTYVLFRLDDDDEFDTGRIENVDRRGSFLVMDSLSNLYTVEPEHILPDMQWYKILE